MRLAVKQQRLIATILVAAVVVAALAVLCADGIHVPSAGDLGDACAAMTHSAALGAAEVTGSSAAIASLFVAAAVGYASVFSAAFMRPANRHLAVSIGRSVDPLYGRLRL
jgi:hypothetical protein